MSGHTPGPWRIEDGEVRIVAPDDRHSTSYARVADASSWWLGDDQAKANARLIAAAPDLLAELRLVADVLHTKVEAGEILGEPMFHIVTGIDRAIAKATGSQVTA